MGFLDMLKKNKSDSFKEIQKLYRDAMDGLNSAKTPEEKEAALERADTALNRMAELGIKREDQIFSELERQVNAARRAAEAALEKSKAEAAYLEGGLRRVENTQAAKNIGSRVSDTARQLQEEMLQRQYSSLIELKKCLDSGGSIPNDGRYASDIYDKLPSYEKKYLFLPYLLELQALGVLTAEENKLLDDMKLIAAADTGKYENGYKTAVENLHAIGAINIRDEACFLNSFDKICTGKEDRKNIADYAEYRRTTSKVYKETSGGYGPR